MRPLHFFLLLISLTSAFSADEKPQPRWKDGKKAVFLLAFDDGCPSQLKNVIPELQKRKITGTFYLNPAAGQYLAHQSEWADAVKSAYVTMANHTLTHKGVKSAAELDVELAKCNEALYALRPDLPFPRLLAFGQPGGVPWEVTKEEFAAALARHQLVDRPPFQGPPIHYKSAAELIGAVDQALATEGIGHADFHGVGGDWLVTPVEWFTALLDKLEKHRDELWVTDPVSLQQFIKARDQASVKK